MGEVRNKGNKPRSFAARLKLARKAVGLSQAALARRAGLTQQSLNMLENAKRRPTLATALKITGVLEKMGFRTADFFLIPVDKPTTTVVQ